MFVGHSEEIAEGFYRQKNHEPKNGGRSFARQGLHQEVLVCYLQNGITDS